MFGLLPRRTRTETSPRLLVSPFTEIEDMANRMFSDLMTRPATGMPTTGMVRGVSTPSFNVYRENSDIVVEASVPGYRKDDIDVEVDEDVLTIIGRTREETKEEEKDYYYREFTSGSFRRSLRLPDSARPEELKAKYRDGILEVRAPSRETSKSPKKVNIE